MSNLKELIGKKRLFADGAMGTLLQAAGLPDGYLPDLWVLENPEAVKNVHRAYINAGCNLITTNTFGANALKLAQHGKTVQEVAGAAVRLVREAISESGRDDVFVAIDLGPTGKLLEPLGDLPFEKAVELFAETVKAGAEAGADAVIIETMSDTYEIKAAVLAAKESCNLPVLCTMVFDEKGQLLTGADLKTAVSLLEGLGADAIGLNCSMGPEAMKPLVKELYEITELPLIVSPNAGLPKTENGKTYFDVTPADFAEEMKEIAKYCAINGGCCGTTPEHISEMIKNCADIEIPVPKKNNILRISSYAKCVEFDKKPIIIGERINPTGKKLFKQALRDGDEGYILREGIKQEECGADVLDVNVGLPEIDECAVLKSAVLALQKVTRLPLQIDTSDYTAMEQALRIYNGRPLINSVNGKEESLDAVLPLAKKYGGAIVALALDENGIPETAEGRLAVARKIVERAEKIGIKRKDIIVDTLTLPVSADAKAADVTLQALELVSKELGVKTVLGVSNVSFGLPMRGIVNSTFFTLALEHGLGAGIINPCSAEMMQVYDAFCALHGFDENCEQYIQRHSASAPEEKKVASEEKMTLCNAVIKGLDTQAASIADALAETENPLDIINKELVPALDYVGEKFEKGTLYLPQLLMSAEAAKAAFDSLKKHMNSDSSDESRDKVLIATVRGDIHDIGKNIVKVLLENYRFEVYDLGKDVAPEVIAETVVKENIRLVALSALMTTTVPAMEETVKLLRKVAPETKIMVGGAVLTQEYSDSIGADFYGRDAMEAVRYAQRVFE